MDVEVIRPAQLGSASQTAWRAMQDDDPRLANPFLAPEFTLAVGRVRRSARIAVLNGERGRPVGFFPFERRACGLGRPIGAGVSGRQGVVHSSRLVLDPAALLRACRLQLWEYDRLSAGQGPLADGAVRRVPSPVIHTGPAHEPYGVALWRRSPGGLRALQAKERKLVQDVGELRFVFDERAPDVLETLMRWRSAQSREKGRADLFARSWIRSLVTDLHGTRSQGCMGTVSALYADGRLVACTFGLRSPRVLANWFPAYDAELTGYSPGLLLYLMLAEGAAVRGIDHIDLGKGTERYKQAVKTGDLVLSEGRVDRGTPAAALRRRQTDTVRALRGRVARSPVLRRAALRTVEAAGNVRGRPGPGPLR